MGWLTTTFSLPGNSRPVVYPRGAGASPLLPPFTGEVDGPLGVVSTVLLQAGIGLV